MSDNKTRETLYELMEMRIEDIKKLERMVELESYGEEDGKEYETLANDVGSPDYYGLEFRKSITDHLAGWTEYQWVLSVVGPYEYFLIKVDTDDETIREVQYVHLDWFEEEDKNKITLMGKDKDTVADFIENRGYIYAA